MLDTITAANELLPLPPVPVFVKDDGFLYHQTFTPRCGADLNTATMKEFPLGELPSSGFCPDCLPSIKVKGMNLATLVSRLQRIMGLLSKEVPSSVDELLGLIRTAENQVTALSSFDLAVASWARELLKPLSFDALRAHFEPFVPAWERTLLSSVFSPPPAFEQLQDAERLFASFDELFELFVASTRKEKGWFVLLLTGPSVSLSEDPTDAALASFGVLSFYRAFGRVLMLPARLMPWYDLVRNTPDPLRVYVDEPLTQAELEALEVLYCPQDLSSPFSSLAEAVSAARSI